MTRKTEKRIHIHFLDFFLIFVPISLISYYLSTNDILTFVTSGLAIAGITHLMAEATAILAERVSTTISALLNATFGNAIEFFIAIFALRNGLVEMVRASIVGSVLINVLFLIGLAMLAGGLKYKEQKFNKESAGLSSTMLIIAVIGLSLPSIYSLIVKAPAQSMSIAVSVILGITYILSLVYTFGTHRHLFIVERYPTGVTTGRWSTRTAMVVLFVATLIASFESSFLVNSIQPLVSQTGLTETFMGLVFIALLTNIPEHISAVSFARRNNMTLALEIGMSSALQIALFVVPVLVLISITFAGGGLELVFSPFELVAIVFTAMLANYIGSDGVCHWVEGVQLIAVYLLIATAFFFL